MVVWVFVLAVGVMAFVNVDQAHADEVLASWYGPGFEGQPTASGEAYDPYGYTAASKTLPLGTELMVSYQGSSVPVTVNDRGPYVGSRGLDLSQAAAQDIGLTEAGVDYVEYSYAQPGYEEPAYTEPTYTEPTEPAPVSTEAAYTESAPSGDYAASETSYTEDTAASQGSYSETQPASGASGGAYVVQAGDTLSGIAAQLGTTTETLASYNGITDVNYIQAGQAINY